MGRVHDQHPFRAEAAVERPVWIEPRHRDDRLGHAVVTVAADRGAAGDDYAALGVDRDVGGGERDFRLPSLPNAVSGVPFGSSRLTAPVYPSPTV